MYDRRILICRFGDRRKKKQIIHPICSVVAVFKMLVRILNTLPSRIWDVLFFLTILNLQLVRREILLKVMAFRKINLSLLLCCRCVLDARPHLKHAPKPHLGCIIFSDYSKSTVGEKGYSPDGYGFPGN